MADIIPDRVSATPEGSVVVFLIGMRINALWKPHKWVPPALAMLRMQRVLDKAAAETGCLATIRATPGLTVQYWRSFEDLERFAHSEAHQPDWARFNRSVAKARGDVGIWHETYLVPDGGYESLYSGMPLHGLGRVKGVVPAKGAMRSARERLGRAEDR